jgi:hypothetical protein
MEAYRFRNLPCSCVPDDELWAVSGYYKNQCGVLEWCTSKEDAHGMMAFMRKHEGFRKLRVHKWVNPKPN